MPVVTTVLHVHEREGSHDSRTPAGEMASAYQSMFDTPVAVGFVGHDEEVHVRTPGVITFSGSEFSKTSGPNGIHVIQFDEPGIRILAHPGRTWPNDTKREAKAAIEKYNIDAVEKYTGGRKQYEGHLPVVELNGDDAHSPIGAGRSSLRVDAPRLSKHAIAESLSRGDFDMVNRTPLHWSLLHTADRGVMSAISRTPLGRFV